MVETSVILHTFMWSFMIAALSTDFFNGRYDIFGPYPRRPLPDNFLMSLATLNQIACCGFLPTEKLTKMVQGHYVRSHYIADKIKYLICTKNNC